ncbi:hypothetical protein DMP06_02825 [Slackia equolifaciens]|uniref:Uncharacterized protein n=1 Tax=Slackia equolifaciens TaxID=498718 RepID=A0A3N0B365_9ACTN|nr:hypothetical protein DMP06_02825 [Slackia equolifaciens]
MQKYRAQSSSLARMARQDDPIDMNGFLASMRQAAFVQLSAALRGRSFILKKESYDNRIRIIN